MKILLVDADAITVEVLLPLLKNTPGNELQTASSGDEALEKATAWGGVDLLITEVFMEPMNGFTLRNKLQNRFAGTKAVFISEYDLTDYAEHVGGCEVVPKPVQASKLLMAMARTTLGAPAAPVESPAPAATPDAPTPSAPRAVPVARAAAPQVSSAPKVVAAASVATAARPVVATQPIVRPVAAVKAAPAPAAMPGEVQIGQQIGTYKILRKLGDGKWGAVYEAEQTSMGRLVAMKVLSPDLQRRPATKSQFNGNASAKANVRHPSILSVYEAGEADGHCYYTHEYVEGENLASLAAQGVTVDSAAALQIVKVVAEALSSLHQQKIAHSPLETNSIYLGHDKRPRLANLATLDGNQPPVPEEIHTLGRAVAAIFAGDTDAEPGLEMLLARMQATGPQGFLSWIALLQAVTMLEPKVRPADAFKLTAQDAAAIRAVEAARRKQKLSLIYTIVGSLVLAAISAWVIYRTFFVTHERLDLENMVRVPAGEFIYQNGEKATTKEFWIDQYEVTIGEYAKFLAYLEQHPTTGFDHPRQPRGKSHYPMNKETWDIYYARAQAGKPAKFTPIDLTCPVFNVDYWDAYAYANWKGHRLPTEQEWEKAARGTDGRLYPWGNDFDPKRFNGKADWVEHPGPDTKAEVDGYWWWSPVDAKPEDKSPYGVVGMAGNVSEWTDTWVGSFPVIRGGNFRFDDWQTTKRVIDKYPETYNEYTGFRTVSDTPPGKN